MLAVRDLTKRYGGRAVVDGLEFTVEPGRVTGFLGPNGAGKSTTMRLLLGLARPTSGTALVNGLPYERLRMPAREVGALLDTGAAHPGRTGRAHLRAKAHVIGVGRDRVDAVLAEAGMAEAADRRINTYSLGMRRRLGVADALLGDPGVLMFDEPVNGLDLDGMRWMRGLARRLADEGRTVFVSSHLMGETQLIADHLVVLGRGRLLADTPLAEAVVGWSKTYVVVRTPDSAALTARLARLGPPVRVEEGPELRVFGLTVEEVGEHAYAVGARVHGLHRAEVSLERAYLELTGEAVEYSAGGAS